MLINSIFMNLGIYLILGSIRHIVPILKILFINQLGSHGKCPLQVAVFKTLLPLLY
jgi:hypothetical protein